MHYLSLVLHFYQPPTQEAAITKTVLESCYLPLLRMLSQKTGYGITLNISGSLIAQLQRMGAGEFFDLVRTLIQKEHVELVTSMMYHPLLPLTPKDVVERQIEKNQEVLKHIFGVEKIHGFFPPELAIDQEHLDMVQGDYVIVDERAIELVSKTYMPVSTYGKTFLLTNNHEACELLRSYPKMLSAGMVREVVQKNSHQEGLVVIANDAELFGHHYAERLQVLADLLDSKDINCITASHAIKQFGPGAPAVSGIMESTWQDCQGLSLWNGNALQKEYLELQRIVHEFTLGHLDGAVGDFMDQGYSSCYLYWLSNWPWWHPSLVEEGAENLIKAVRIARIDYAKKALAEAAYHQFLHHLWQYQWSGRVEENYQKYTNTRDISGVGVVRSPREDY